MKTFVIVAVGASLLLVDGAMAGPFVPAGLSHHSLAEKTHWVRRRWAGYSGPPYGIQYSRAYSYAFDSSYYRSGYAGCVGVQHMCASRWGWAGSAYRRCLSDHRWC
ncbi:hypothetical protein [Hyphomicrobium sp.]|uniref:hypothetical protein n=1 Tax=Hyphomicrobium sp. TaxID=82 RepID=UPI00356A56A2